jgi:hypothetical protein
MGEEKEDKIYAEWRDIVIQKLNSLDKDIKDLQTDVRDAMVTSQEVSNLKEWAASLDREVSQIKEKDSKNRENIIKEVRENFTSKDQFEPVKKLVWTTVSVVLIAFISAILALIIRSG